PKGQEQRTKRLEAITTALEAKQRAVGVIKLRIQALMGLRSDVEDFRSRLIPEWIADTQERRSDAGLSDNDWQSFDARFVSDVDALLTERLRMAQVELKRLEGPALTDPPEDPGADPGAPLIPDEADLSVQTMRLLERERDRLQKLVGLDEQNARRYKVLTDKIQKAETALANVVTQIERTAKSDEILKSLRGQRNQAYKGIFDAVVEEEHELADLYAPLKERIASGPGAVSKLSFSVRRLVDVNAWAERGEALLDLRTGPFRGKGELLKVAEETLGKVWREGSAIDVSTAMTAFIAMHADSLKQHMPAQENYREWARKVAEWLYNTNHVLVGYGLQYDGVEIEHLSPGTRGIVLLLLYLAIDADDDRPLIIDQPEENLDPQSVFDELVPVFREAKKRRQIIIVTHNANLVVNTDVDQVIVARCGPHRPGQLPEICYESGGLENPAIRKAVCAILEGGERAFRERARRLRIAM
ncbi:MAG: AAA family ATPase, partial [Sterolibacterium sp.]